MKKSILTTLVGLAVLCGLAYANDYVIINQGANRFGFLLTGDDEITHTNGNTVNIIQNGQTQSFDVSEVDSITFVKDQEQDNVAPSIYILNPTSDATFVTNENKISLSGVASDNIAIKQITYSTSTGLTGVATGHEEWSIADVDLAIGDNVITVTAVDIEDNTASASITITRNHSLAFLGTPFVDFTLLYTNAPKEVWMTVNIAPNDKLIASSVKVVEVDENNNVLSDVSPMYDDGDLSHGDEIKGDNIFSTKHTFNYSTPGIKRFRVSAKTQEPEGQVEGFSSVFTIKVIDWEEAEQEAKTLEEIHNMIEDKMQELEGLTNDEKAEVLIDWLLSFPEISDAVYEDGFIVITHVNGMTSYILLPEEGSRGGRTQSTDIEKRRNSKQMPLDRQTRGIVDLSTRFAQSGMLNAVVDNNIIQNKNVLIWAPFDNNGIPAMDPAPFNNSPVNLNVTELKNQQCTRSTLKALDEYGVIVFDTHGKDGNLLLSREVFDVFAADDITQVIENIDDVVSGYCYAVTVGSETYYGISSSYFTNRLHGKLPNSVIFNGSCASLKTEQLAQSLIKSGAKTYVGFTGTVTNTFCKTKEQQFFTALAGNYLRTTGESFNNSDNPVYQMRGSKDMHYTLGLINGDFEYGNLNGWTTVGDGRVITQLGSQFPTQGTYMGIISTGLGYTENYGRISQTFQVTNENYLSLKWNFLSEEFMEWVGSQFQDYLKITIIAGEESEVLFYKAVDDFAAEYDLIYVSPTIVFDRGDVYMTGWMTSTFDISKYQGMTVTLLIESGDVGDSIYDSATLLDEISVY